MIGAAFDRLFLPVLWAGILAVLVVLIYACGEEAERLKRERVSTFVEMPNTVNLLIPVPEDWRDIIKADAHKRDETLAEWARAAFQDRLPKSARKQLSDPPKMGRPKKQEGE